MPSFALVASRFFLSYWIGSMLFFSFVFAPRVFKILERSDAGMLQNALFPPYFFTLMLSAIVCALVWGFARKFFQCGCAVVASIVFAFCFLWLTPELIQIFEQGGTPEEFQRLHKMSVYLNGFALVLGLVSLSQESKSSERTTE